MNYNCEVWNQMSKHKIEAINNKEYRLEKLYFDTPGEKLHLQFCRNILGMSNKTSVVATLGELGCYPLMIKSFSQMIKYWHHIKTQVDSSTLIHEAVSFMESRENFGQYTWLSTIKFILFYCGMQEVWFNPQTIKNGSIAFKCNIIKRNKFVEYWSNLLHNQHSSALNSQEDSNLPVNNLLRTYHLIKSNYTREDYLIHITNRDERRMLAKRRCSNHSLLIETDRHSKIEESDRKCSRCNKVEDEIHFNVECLLYDLTRDKFVKNFSININGVNMKDAFICLFSSKEAKLLKQFAKFITACFEIIYYTFQS